MPNSLKGQLLVATPEMGDDRFYETIIYLVSHNESGAMGLVINNPIEGMQFSDVLEQMNLGEPEELINIPNNIQSKEIFRGGPVDQGRGFVLHSSDRIFEDSTFQVDKKICLTASSDILKSLAFGPAPKNSLLALGYCGWSSGQLEGELKQNGWLITNYSDELLFNIPISKRYDRALKQIGATRASLSPVSGNA